MISGVTLISGNSSERSNLNPTISRSSAVGTSHSNCWSPVDNNPSLIMDQQMVELCYKWLDRVVHLCLDPRLKLKNSPPYLLDIIPDIYEKLKSITSQYAHEYDPLAQPDYLRVFFNSVIQKCERTVKLFKCAGEKMYNFNSHARFRLAKLSLIFSHLLKDLEALFPHNTIYTAFRITKSDAANWWSDNFGQTVIVPWSVFQTALLHTFRVDSADQLIALRNTIDLTCNKYVSIFEFDVFVRLFQPWGNILETWKALAVLHPGYMAFKTYDGVKAVLEQYRSYPGPGTYVFRLSCTKLGQWAIGYVAEDLKILQTIIQNKSLAQALLDGEREGFYLYPNGQFSPSELLYLLVYNLPQVRLQVTQEQYQVYYEMGSTFELCKICDENNKNVQLEPCGHLICKHCLFNCRSVGYGQTCPFCRLEIKSIADVIVDPYRPSPSQRSSVYETFRTINLGTDKLSKINANSLCGQFNSSSWIKSMAHFSVRESSLALGPKPPPVPPRNATAMASLCFPNNFKHKQFKETHKQDRHVAREISTANPLKPDVACSTNYPLSCASCNSFLGLQCFGYPSPSQLLNCDRGSVKSYHPGAMNRSVPSAFNSESAILVPPGQLCGTRINYAQLDLNSSDSEHEASPELEFGSTPTMCAKDFLFNPSHHDSSLSIVHSSLQPIVRPDFAVRSCTVAELKTVSTITTIGPTTSTDPSSFIHSNNRSSPSETGTIDSVSRLCHMYVDLDELTANLLLSITRNDFPMASQIWRHFVLRPQRHTS